MKKQLLLSALLIFACSSDESSDTNNDDNNNNNTFICDGVPYDSIVYGTQEWTVENACHITYRDGTSIPEVTDNIEWENLTTGAWCYFNNDPTKPRLYNWFAVMGIHDTDPNTPNKEFIPEGWHVPSDAEWTTLEEYLIAYGYNYDGTTTGNKIAKAMASTTGWNTSTDTGAIGNDQSLNNSTAFNAFPQGRRWTSFVDLTQDAIFWTSTEWSWTDNEDGVMARGLHSYTSGLDKRLSFKWHGFSARFVRD